MQQAEAALRSSLCLLETTYPNLLQGLTRCRQLSEPLLVSIIGYQRQAEVALLRCAHAWHITLILVPVWVKTKSRKSALPRMSAQKGKSETVRVGAPSRVKTTRRRGHGPQRERNKVRQSEREER